MSKKINPKQKKFVREYTKDFNTYKAMIAAGYAETTAIAGGRRMLENVGVKEAIEKYIQRDENNVDDRRREIVEKTHEMMNADILDLYDSVHGELMVKSLTDVPRGVRDLIQEIQTINLPDGGGLGCKIKLIPRDRIIALNAKIHGMLIDRQEVKIDQKVTLVECLQEIDERERQNKIEADSVSD
jgi:hypothetical protein